MNSDREIDTNENDSKNFVDLLLICCIRVSQRNPLKKSQCPGSIICQKDLLSCSTLVLVTSREGIFHSSGYCEKKPRMKVLFDEGSRFTGAVTHSLLWYFM